MGRRSVQLVIALLLAGTASIAVAQDGADFRLFIDKHCADCHDAEQKAGDLDLTALASDFAAPETFARWVKVHDRIASGEMPPPKKPRPPVEETAAVTNWLRESLSTADRSRRDPEGLTGVRRLTRAEYENTVRDLFDMPGIPLQDDLPADGSAHGFDNNADALDISHVNLARYLEAADRVLDLAIAKQRTRRR